jgi:Zn-dependent protease
MFGKRVRLFTLLGFNVSVDASWLVIALLVAWSLATAYFPLRNPHLDHTTYWVMGALGALGLFVSIVVHEFAHSLVARKYGVSVRRRGRNG